MPPLDVNFLAVVVAAVVWFVLGALWYGPLFGQRWAAEMNLDPEDMQAAKVNYAITFVANLGLALALASILHDVTDLGSGLAAAFGLWLGLVATTGTINAVWDNRSWFVFGVNQGYHLVGMLVAAAIVTLWK